MVSSKRVKTVAGALALVRRKGAAMLVPDLVEAIAGEPIRGTWWAHPSGNAIFRIASALEDHREILVGKLIDGKVTFVHARLWPALLRVVTDERWRKARIAELDAPARALLARVERAGRVAVEKADAKAQKSLAPSALVQATQEHTESGKHRAVLSSWRAWATPELLTSAASLEMDAAFDTLVGAGIELTRRA